MILKFGKKLLSALPTLFGVSLFAFLLIRLAPGDPVLTLLGERGADPEVYQQMKQSLGLDKPVYQQFFIYLGDLVQLDLGTSIHSKQSVWSEFISRFPATMELSIMAIIIAIIVGLILGVVAALYKGKIIDTILMSSALVGYSMPIFWWGLVLILIFSSHFGITPVAGRMSALYEVNTVTGFYLIDAWFSDNPVRVFNQALRHMILPAVVLATIPMAAIARMTRSSLLDVLKEDYIRTAKSKGLSSVYVISKHALRNAFMPILTVMGVMFGTLLTGAILTETIFSWPGIGKWILNAVQARDYPVIQGGVVLIALIIFVINSLVDFLYIVVNPRLRK